MAKRRGKRTNPFASKEVVKREYHQVRRMRDPLGENVNAFEDVLPKVMKKAGLKQEFTIERLADDWIDIVGPDTARFCRPFKVEQACLTVYVLNPVWLMMLKRDTRIILAKVNQALPDQNIRRIFFQLDPQD